MKILMVSIPNHHFFQWVNQLEESGYEVYWFDITDGGAKVDRIDWVTQGKGWKQKWDFPFRHTLKAKLPKWYQSIQKINERNVTAVFKDLLVTFKPDIVHCFEMRLSGFPILKVMEENPTIDFVYSSWGSDLFFYEELGGTKQKVNRFLRRVNYLITDCKRDHRIASQNGFTNTFLGDYIGNGGLDIKLSDIASQEERRIIIIKGYEDGVGKAIQIIDAIESLPASLLHNLEIVIYSADSILKERIESSAFFKQLQVTVHVRGQFIANADLLKIMGRSLIHLANSISDGLPTSSVEAIGMGAFPIQSNPGGVSEEVIKHGVNGFLIEDPYSISEIAICIKKALENETMRAQAQAYNVAYVQENFNRDLMRPKIVALYQNVNSK
ncbi:glycosyltransferase family 4 protein [Flavobacterium algicola]|uniref:glycosyltransferase family 4 protein n=1 Tax=Flavobacterium algicola TaxID=556529 RepID=UPI001EFDD10F|nr:glycosyltransferase family 4 protein [Flavobacterium algicola]MCG9793892.1 glycosyltransferase family 4 protein [Flavobacterium algicola]